MAEIDVVATRSQQGPVGRLLLVSADRPWALERARALDDDGFLVGVLPSWLGVAEAVRQIGADLTAVDVAGATSSLAAQCRAIRAVSDGLLLAIGSSGDGEIEAALVAGADGHVARTATHRELVARLRALLRRNDLLPRERAGGPSDVQLGPLAAGLGPAEVAVIAALLERRGAVVSRTTLLRRSGLGPGASGELDVVVRRIRHHLEAGGAQRCITAVRGVGFRFDAPLPTGDSDLVGAG